jgi:hypothetical protein
MGLGRGLCAKTFFSFSFFFDNTKTLFSFLIIKTLFYEIDGD